MSDGTGSSVHADAIEPPGRSGKVLLAQPELGSCVIGQLLPRNGSRRIWPGPPSGHPVCRSRAESTVTVVDQRRSKVVHTRMLTAVEAWSPLPPASWIWSLAHTSGVPMHQKQVGITERT